MFDLFNKKRMKRLEGEKRALNKRVVELQSQICNRDELIKDMQLDLDTIKKQMERLEKEKEVVMEAGFELQKQVVNKKNNTPKTTVTIDRIAGVDTSIPKKARKSAKTKKESK